jgi:transposase
LSLLSILSSFKKTISKELFVMTATRGLGIVVLVSNASYLRDGNWEDGGSTGCTKKKEQEEEERRRRRRRRRRKKERKKEREKKKERKKERKGRRRRRRKRRRRRRRERNEQDPISSSMVEHTCNSRYEGGIGREIGV